MKQVILEQAEKTLKNPQKNAMLNMATTRDSCLLEGRWQHAFSVWEHGKAVEGINHFGRHKNYPGDLLEIHDVENAMFRYYAQIQRLVMVYSDQLTDAEVHALGYTDRTAYLLDIGERLAGRQGWLVYFAPVAPNDDGIQH